MKRSFKLLLRNWLLHFAIVWIIILSFTVIAYAYNSSIYGPSHLNPDNTPVTVWQYFLSHIFHGYDMLLVLFVLFLMEVNYQFVFKKTRLIIYVCICLLAGMISLFFIAYTYKSGWAGVVYRTPIILYITAYALIYSFIRDYWHTIRHKKDIEIQQSKNELDALKAQLNPHFLFNSLNYLYGTALNEKAPTTADGIDKLSDMMRYTITGVHENFVSLDDELKFTENYLALQQARLPKIDNIRVDIKIEHSSRQLQIAPLLLLPFIENAFKYGISVDEPCYVIIEITVNGDTLTMHISNSIIKGLMEIKGNSIGIKNTQKRLDLLYADDYQLQQTNNGMEYKTLLTIKLNG